MIRKLIDEARILVANIRHPARVELTDNTST